MPPPDDVAHHYQLVVQQIIDGHLVPFLGSGANRCGRGPDFKPGENLPDGTELAKYLAAEFKYAGANTSDLAHVSQYVALALGTQALFKKIHALLDHDVPLTSLHRLLAGVPKALRKAGRAPHQLIVTTNYDDLLERAFDEAGEDYDVVTYVAVGGKRGKFHHRQPDGSWKPVIVPNKYLDVSTNYRSVILKMHGAVDRVNHAEDGFVITEDHYIEYLARADVSKLVPALLAAKLTQSSFLFLGYSLRDWNLRVILHRIWGDQRLSNASWAIQKDGDIVDQKLWGQKFVEIRYTDLGPYIQGLAETLDKAVAELAPPTAPGAGP